MEAEDTIDGSTEAPDDDFARRANPFRVELQALCYRMLGSLHDAEDAVQETYLRAWRGYGQFDGRSSLRTWLYQIATRVCLRALEQTGRRPLPSGLRGPSDEPEGRLEPGLSEVPWLEPFPTAPAGESDDPSNIVEGRSRMRLALIAALQLLPPRQRVVLILRDVLDWRAAEVADVLETTTTAVNSLLQRARSQLERAGITETAVDGRLNENQTALLERYATAFENADITALMQILEEDAVWEMPPFATWFVGRQNIRRFLVTRLLHPGDNWLIRTEANGQPAFAVYTKDSDGNYQPHALQVLSIGHSSIARIVAFLDPVLVTAFRLASPLSSLRVCPVRSTLICCGGR